MIRAKGLIAKMELSFEGGMFRVDAADQGLSVVDGCKSGSEVCGGNCCKIHSEHALLAIKHYCIRLAKVQ